MVEESCLPYGSQETERVRGPHRGRGDRHTPQRYTPSNPLLPTEPHILVAHSAISLSIDQFIEEVSVLVIQSPL